MRAILTEAVDLTARIKLGSLLAGVLDDEDKLTEAERNAYFDGDRGAEEPMEFGQ